MTIKLLIIDPQVDFMDAQGSALPVTGATEDMNRMAAFIAKHGNKLDSIDVTLDSHHELDIAHPAMWRDENGKMPDSFTLIWSKDIKAGIWTPILANQKLPILGGLTVKQYTIAYTEFLESTGKKVLCIWPAYCRIGTPGHNVQETLMAELLNWGRKNSATVDFTVKGTSPWTEHYGALMAEKPLASDPTTSLNTRLLETLAEADVIPVGGEASSHCIMTTVDQIADNIGDEHIRKFHLFTDCMSPVGAVPGFDFPVLAQEWLNRMKDRGMTLTTSTDFLS